MSTLQVNIQNSKSTNFITCKGDLVGAEALDFKSVLKRCASQDMNLSIDLIDVSDISLTGLNSILMAKAWTKGQDKQVRLILPKTSKVLRYLEMTKMTDEFIIEYGAVNSNVA